ncbi:hypothetical protein [Reyranella sp.]|uniref:hypothetical protein n=1 Tax=Reyranella sp. TaxID=1929291 RepID=UPI003D152CAC
MTSGSQAVVLARLQAIDGTSADKARVVAWDRLFAMLNALDSKTSALLRFNAITVAALAYIVVVSGVDPFAQAKPLVRTMGIAVGHISLVLSVASCGFAFPVIGVARGFFDATPGLDDGVLDRLGRLVAQRTRLYLWAWRLAVAGGLGFAVLVALATIH